MFARNSWLLVACLFFFGMAWHTAEAGNGARRRRRRTS